MAHNGHAIRHFQVEKLSGNVGTKPCYARQSPFCGTRGALFASTITPSQHATNGVIPRHSACRFNAVHGDNRIYGMCTLSSFSAPPFRILCPLTFRPRLAYLSARVLTCNGFGLIPNEQHSQWSAGVFQSFENQSKNKTATFNAKFFSYFEGNVCLAFEHRRCPTPIAVVL